MSIDLKEKKYRKCVGIMILNQEKKILVGKRIDHPSGFWQMPQGGIDNNEEPEEAVWREMKEEIGTYKAKLIKVSEQWISYDIPQKTLNTLPWGKKYIGQTQKWFAFKFTGDNKDIDVGTKNPEFSEWKWAEMSTMVDNIVPFKRDVYSKILKEFKDIF